MESRYIKKSSRAFTIVELLIVIVVIGILAAITIVSFNGVQNRARVATTQSDLENAAKQLEVYKLTVSSANSYPVDLSTAGLKASTNTTYVYSNNSAANTYCLTATNSGTSYYVASGTAMQSGTCLLTNGLVGWWNFNGNTNDASGNANNGVNNGATLTAGQNGQANGAYSFSGSANYIDLLNPTVFPSGTSARSMCTWAKTNATTGYSWIFAYGTANNNAAMFLGNNGTQLLGGSYGASSDITIDNFWTAGTWRQLCLTFDGATATLYADGAQLSSRTAPWNLTRAVAAIGRQVNNGEYWNGSIDDVRLYNRALSSSEIQALYGSGAQ